MNGFSDIVVELCASLKLEAPTFLGRTARIEINDIAILISGNNSSLTFSAVSGSLPMTNPERQDKIRKVLQGAFSILRSHNILITAKPDNGKEIIVAETTIGKTKYNIKNLMDELSSFYKIVSALNMLITNNNGSSFKQLSQYDSSDDSEEMEFVFRP